MEAELSRHFGSEVAAKPVHFHLARPDWSHRTDQERGLMLGVDAKCDKFSAANWPTDEGGMVDEQYGMLIPKS